MVGIPAKFEKRTVTGVESRWRCGARVSEAASGEGVNPPVSSMPFACAGLNPGWIPPSTLSKASMISWLSDNSFSSAVRGMAWLSIQRSHQSPLYRQNPTPDRKGCGGAADLMWVSSCTDVQEARLQRHRGSPPYLRAGRCDSSRETDLWRAVIDVHRGDRPPQRGIGFLAQAGAGVQPRRYNGRGRFGLVDCPPPPCVRSHMHTGARSCAGCTKSHPCQPRIKFVQCRPTDASDAIRLRSASKIGLDTYTSAC